MESTYLYTQDDLNRGDRDKKGERPGRPANITGNQVYDLQTDLKSFGYDEVGQPDGIYGKGTQKAVKAFQKDAKTKYRKKGDETQELEKSTYNGDVNGTIGDAEKEEIKIWKEKGYVKPETSLIFPGTKFKYQRTTMSLEDCLSTLPSQLRPDFKKEIEVIIKEMHKLGIAFGTPSKYRAGYRTFTDQTKISKTATKAGPGESFHCYGLAVDLGVLNWVDEDGKSYNDFWLGKMDKIKKYKGFSSKIWYKRNSCSNKVFPLSYEIIHMQAVPAKSSGKALLTKALNKAAAKTGYSGWTYTANSNTTYNCNLGNKSKSINIGTSSQMFSGSSPNATKDQKAKIKKDMEKAEEVALTIAP